jgi:hypothetical protein
VIDMSDEEQIEQITQQAAARYGSFEAPNRSFQSIIDRERPYRELVDDLMTHFFLNDATEWNHDVSFRYVVKDTSGCQWMLQLSMVARYGEFFSLGVTHPILLEPTATNVAGSESVIRRLLRDHDVTLLGEKIMTTAMPIKLFYTEPENVAVYQVLFSDTDILPWRAIDGIGARRSSCFCWWTARNRTDSGREGQSGGLLSTIITLRSCSLN